MPGSLMDFYKYLTSKGMNITPGYRSPDVEDWRNDPFAAYPPYVQKLVESARKRGEIVTIGANGEVNFNAPPAPPRPAPTIKPKTKR